MANSEKLVNISYRLLIITVLLSININSSVFTQSTLDNIIWTSNIDSKAVRNYNQFIKKLFTITDESIEIIHAGSVNYNNIEYPVYALSYIPDKKPVIRIFLAAGQHGNEPATAYSVIKFFEYIIKNKYFYTDIAIDAIPMINPWGWVYDKRFGGGGHDINRDYYRFSSQEARIVRDFVKEKTYNYMIDHHESPSDGAFIFNYNEEMFDICNNLMNNLRAEGYGIGVKGYFQSHILTNGINDIPSRRRSLSIINNNTRLSYWSRNSTIVRYFSSEFNAYGFTMETSTYKKFEHRINCHFDVMQFMTAAFRNYKFSS